MHKIIVDYAPTENDNAILREGITAFNESILGERDKAFSIFLKNDLGEVLGGIQAFILMRRKTRFFRTGIQDAKSDFGYIHI